MATSVSIPAGPTLGDTSVVFTFDGDYQVGQFCNGDWWVVGGTGRNIIAISPACQTNWSGGFSNSANTYTDRTINGAQINHGCSVDAIGPLGTQVTFGRNVQGYDSLVTGQAYLPYSDAINSDPGLPGNGPISMATPISVVKAVSRPSPTADTRPVLDDLVVLTVLASAPPAGSFRPAIATADKSILYNKSALNYSILPHLDRTLVASRPTLAQALVYVQRMRMIGCSSLLNARNIAAYNPLGSPYGQFYARLWDQAYISLLMDYTPTELEPIYIAIIQAGIDIIGRCLEGGQFQDNGGGNMGHKFPAIMVALNWPTTNNVNIASTVTSPITFQEDRQVFVVSNADVARPVGYQPQYAYTTGGTGYAVGDVLTDANPNFDGLQRGVVKINHICANGQPGNATGGPGGGENPGVGGYTVVTSGDYYTLPPNDCPYSGGSGTGLTLTFPRHFLRYRGDQISSPDWSSSYTSHGAAEGANWDISYRDICSYAFTGSALAARRVTGAMAAWNSPAFFEYMDRAYDMMSAPDATNSPGHGNGPIALQNDAWVAYRGSMAGPTANLIEAAATRETAWLRYDYTLQRRTPPDASAFTVTENGAPHTVINVDIYGRAIRLQTDRVFTDGSTVAVAYAPPTANAVKDLRGNTLAASDSGSTTVAVTASFTAQSGLSASLLALATPVIAALAARLSTRVTMLPSSVSIPIPTATPGFRPITKVPNLPSNIPIVDPATGNPSTQFQRWWQSSVEAGLNALIASANTQAAAAAASAAAATAQKAAASATTAAANAQAAGTSAATAAAAASAQAAASSREAALVNSSISPASVLTCTTTTITIAPHTRNYADGTSQAVAGATIAATGGAGPYVDYVSYIDATRSNPTPTYTASLVAPTQGMDVHVVGAITIPLSGTGTGGSGPRPPGFVVP